MRIAFGPLLLAAVIALPCRAAESTDYSDLWWNPAHNGWGLGLQRQGDVMFATLFIYGTDGTATWLFASDVRPTGATLAWSGKLFRAAGPTFSVPFDGSVGIAEVGNLNLRFDASGKGVLAYTTDGSSVTEPIERMAWRTSIPSGSYYGGMTATAFSCNDPERLDGTVDVLGAMTVSAAGTRLTMSNSSTTVAGIPSTCNFTGDYAQAGRYGTVTGTFRCNIVVGQDGRGESTNVVPRLGSFTMDRMVTTPSGFTARLSAVDQDCLVNGQFGGMKLP